MANPIDDPWCQTNSASAGLTSKARQGRPRVRNRDRDDDPALSVTPDQVKQFQAKVWRAMTWVIFANVIAFWLLTCATAFAQTPGSWVPVYLSYSPNNGGLAYTLTPPASGWRSEGIKFRIKVDAPAYNGQTVNALYSLTLVSRGRSALTTSSTEVAQLQAQGWQSNGVLGYVGSQMASDLTALYRFTHAASSQNLYSTKAPGKDALLSKFGWRYAGIVGYVKPPADNSAGGSGGSNSAPSMPSTNVPTTAPTVSGFTPVSASAGATVTVNGTNLAGATAVRFNGIAATGLSAITATSLQAVVPANATSGKISVTTPAGTVTSSTDFTITVPPPVVNAAYTDAARFLTQATFGPKPESIDRVRTIGAAAWINEQLQKPADSHMAYIDAAKARRLTATGKGYYTEEDSYEAIWQQWLFGQDELRARMTFALSEIMVISNIAPDIEPDAMSSYMDTLNRNAFGNYRDLLNAVTLHPAMGYYLNMLGSEKEDAKNQKFPNENYAREVLQLFSVGLNMLNPDGSRKLDGSGKPIATYDEDTVKGFARAFTGWTFAGNDPNNPKKFDRPDESWTQPMIAFASKHETGTKKLLNGATLPAGQTPEKDMKDALDNIFNHPNVGPFIGRQLIQRFVTSNPSPAYVSRVAAAFDNNGSGVRGDLSAVIKAALLDSEARSAPAAGDTKAGKQREPVIRFANILRAFNAISVNGRNSIHYLDNADDALGQSPLLSPSVFNFFSPFYTRPGKLAAAGMVGPEFQITNEIQTIGTANFFYSLVRDEAYGSGDSRLKLDLASAKAQAGNPAALVDLISNLLTFGDLSAATRQTIIDAVTAVPFNNRDSERTLRVRTALTLFALSADFVIQK